MTRNLEKKKLIEETGLGSSVKQASGQILMGVRGKRVIISSPGSDASRLVTKLKSEIRGSCLLINSEGYSCFWFHAERVGFVHNCMTFQFHVHRHFVKCCSRVVNVVLQNGLTDFMPI